jgi:hypothetical protein
MLSPKNESAKLSFHLQTLQMETKFGRFYKKVWPHLPRNGANFREKTPESDKKVWP